MTRRFLSGLFLLVFAVMAPFAAGQASKGTPVDPLLPDDQLILGKWEVVSAKDGGKDVPIKDKTKIYLLFFGNNRIKFMHNEKVMNDTTYALDPARTPNKAIDIVDKWETEAKDKRQKVILGIYEIKPGKQRKDDTMTLCLPRQSAYKEIQKPAKTKGKDDKGKEDKVKDVKGKEDAKVVDPSDKEKDRPTKFASVKDVGLLTLKRVKIARGDLFAFKDSGSKENDDPKEGGWRPAKMGNYEILVMPDYVPQEVKGGKGVQIYQWQQAPPADPQAPRILISVTIIGGGKAAEDAKRDTKRFAENFSSGAARQAGVEIAKQEPPQLVTSGGMDFQIVRWSGKTAEQKQVHGEVAVTVNEMDVVAFVAMNISESPIAANQLQGRIRLPTKSSAP